MLADSAEGSYFELDRRPLPAVLDTACVRTGLHFQIKNGFPPRSVMSARDGSLRLFMEYDTLVETSERLPRFAKQLGVPATELKRALNRDWLPHIEVVKLPPSLRQIDQRALAVRDRDADDFRGAVKLPLAKGPPPARLTAHRTSHSPDVNASPARLAPDPAQGHPSCRYTPPMLPMRSIAELSRTRVKAPPAAPLARRQRRAQPC